MKIYAIRDRMLDYFQPPVVVNREEDLKAAIARQVNDEKSEIAQAPDHYELWQIGEVDDQGNLRTVREFKVNCARLIRNGVWKRGQPRGPGTEGPTEQAQGRISGPGSHTGAGPGAPTGAPRTTAQQAPQPRTQPGRGDPGVDQGHSER